MPDRYQSGKAAGSLLLLLVLVTGVGGWNYHRNWQIDQASEGARPYASYATSDLEALRGGYALELESDRAKFAHSKRQRGQVARNKGNMTKNVEQFARTTRTSSAIRSAASSVADRESQIAELDKELVLRNQLGQGIAMHLRRLTTF